MADNGRVSAIIAEPVVTVPAGDAVGRVSAIIAEPVVTVPAGDAVGRVSAIIAEPVVTVPAGDAVGRVSAIIAEPIVSEVGTEARVAFLFVEVFSEAPTTKSVRRATHIQGQGISTLNRRR